MFAYMSDFQSGDKHCLSAIRIVVAVYDVHPKMSMCMHFPRFSRPDDRMNIYLGWRDAFNSQITCLSELMGKSYKEELRQKWCAEELVSLG